MTSPLMLRNLKQYRKNGYRVLLLSGSRTRARRLAEDLRDNEISAVYTEDPYREVLQGEVLTYYGHVGKGFEYPFLKYVVISETDIFGAEKKRKKSSKDVRRSCSASRSQSRKASTTSSGAEGEDQREWERDEGTSGRKLQVVGRASPD